MKNNKIGSLFVITTLALTGIGISYAGFSDIITVYGTVDTATVNLVIEEYSGTWLWKVWDDGSGGTPPADEVYIYRGLVGTEPDEAAVKNQYQNCAVELVSWAKAQAGSGEKEVEMIYHNIFPCTEYTADVYLHYIGTIPVYTGIQNEVWDPIFEIEDLWDINFYAEKGVQDDTGTYIWSETDLPVQLHFCNQLKIELGIHMLQPENANDFQGIVDAAFSFDIEAIQWNEQLIINPPPVNNNQLTITGTGWIHENTWLNPEGYDFATNPYSFDLTSACSEPLALMGFVDTTQCAIANENDWSKYYAKFIIRENSGKHVEVVFGNDWLGPWWTMDAQPWDRIRMENSMGLAQPLQYYATIGGVVDRDMNGAWVGTGNGVTIYPSNQIYYFQLIADPITETFTLQVYAMGSSAPANPPDAWPTQNMYDYQTWLEIGSIVLGAGDFNFEAVEFEADLWASTQAGSTETSTVSWYNMHVGIPLDFSQIP